MMKLAWKEKNTGIVTMDQEERYIYEDKWMWWITSNMGWYYNVQALMSVICLVIICLLHLVYIRDFIDRLLKI